MQEETEKNLFFKTIYPKPVSKECLEHWMGRSDFWGEGKVEYIEKRRACPAKGREGISVIFRDASYGQEDEALVRAYCLSVEWNWDVGAEFRISIKKPGLQGLRP